MSRRLLPIAEEGRPARDVQAEPSRPNGGKLPLPPELKAELRRLLARILVEDYLTDHRDVTDATVAPVGGHNRG